MYANKHKMTVLHMYFIRCGTRKNNWAPSSEFVSSSIPSWQILTAHAQPFRGARGLAFCLKVPLDSLLVWASSEGSGETARMRRLAWTFAARIGYKFAWRGPILIHVYGQQHVLVLSKSVHVFDYEMIQTEAFMKDFRFMHFHHWKLKGIFHRI